MSRVAYFRVAAFFPVLLPLLLYLAVPKLGNDVPDVVGIGLVLMVGAGAFGATYVPTAILFLIWLRKRPESSYTRLAVLAPVIWAPIVGSVVLLRSLLERDHVDIAGVGFLMIVALVVGYGYVLLAFLGLKCLERMGWVVGVDAHPNLP